MTVDIKTLDAAIAAIKKTNESLAEKAAKIAKLQKKRDELVKLIPIEVKKATKKG